MKLQLTSETSSSFDAYYADVEPSSYLQESIKQTRALFDHLERNVEGPPRWVTISHYTRFYLSEVNHWDPCKAQVFVCPREDGYEIKYRSAIKLETESDWKDSFTFLYAHRVEEAGELISTALARAISKPPGRFPEKCYSK